jgi:hypothetical protein
MRARMGRGIRTAAALSAMLMAGAVANAAETRSPARSRELYETIVKKLDTGGDMLTVVNTAGYVEQTLDRVVKSLVGGKRGQSEHIVILGGEKGSERQEIVNRFFSFFFETRRPLSLCARVSALSAWMSSMGRSCARETSIGAVS